MVIPQRIFLAFLSAILAFAVYQAGGSSTPWNLCLLALALLAVAYLYRDPAAPAFRTAAWLPWFPLWIAFQLLPLPLFLLRILSPSRAAILDSLSPLTPPPSFAPISIYPEITLIHFFRLAAYVILFVLIRDLAARFPGRRRWLLAMPLVAIAGAEAAFGLFQNLAGQQAQGTYVNKNHFAGLLEMALPLAASYSGYLFIRRRYLKGLALLGISLLLFGGLLVSFSKMGFVGGLLAIFVAGTLAVVTRSRSSLRWLIAAALALLLIGSFVFLPSDTFVANYGAVSSPGQTDLEGRAPVWLETLHLIADYPVFGCGFGNYETAFLRYQAAVVDRVFTYAHNDYLQVAAELGVGGFLIAALLLLPVLIRPLRASARAPEGSTQFLAYGCCGAFAAIGLHSLADFNMYVPANALAMAWICGLASALPLANEKPSGGRMAVYLRRCTIVLASLLAVYAPVRLLFDSQFRSNAAAEHAFCNFGICDTDAVITAQKLLHGGQASAVPAPELLQALRRDPNAPNRWSDAGQRMQQMGSAAKADYCFTRAVDLAPHIPPVLMEAADHFFAAQQPVRAMHLMARVLADTDTYDDFIFGWYADRHLSVDRILQDGLPPGPRAAQSYMRQLIATEDPEQPKVWAWLTARGFSDLALAREYLGALFARKDYGQAAAAWAAFLAKDRGDFLAANFIYNGGFERDFTNTPLDWRTGDREGVEVAVDNQVAHSGSRSLRIRFAGKENLSYHETGLTIFVKPGRYRFTAYLRLDNLTTDQGIGFHLYDAEQSARLDVRTGQFTGTHDWQRIERMIAVPSNTRLIDLDVSREPSQKFDNAIRGTVWIDDVSLTPVP